VSADHARLKELRIDSIRVGRRHRRDMGDLTALAESIRQEGLLQPIGVTDRLELVFGERRGTQEDEPNRESGGVPSTSLFR
jgi:ParB family chromosome partitioning protein